jgi:outer membrane lipoprotein carrier protein
VGTFVGPLGAAPDASTSVPAQPTVTSLVGQVQAFYAQIKTFSSDFTQTFLVKAHGKTEVRQGHVVFEKPGKMSWRYRDSGRVVSDGRTLSMYQPDIQQMTVHPLAGTQYPAALSFLMGQGNLSQAFDFQLIQPTRPLIGTWILQGTPKTASSGGGYRLVYFYVDAATTQVRKVELVDEQNNRNTFEFVDPVVNEPAPSGEFSFTPPTGTQIVQR